MPRIFQPHDLFEAVVPLAALGLHRVKFVLLFEVALLLGVFVVAAVGVDQEHARASKSSQKARKELTWPWWSKPGGLCPRCAARTENLAARK